MITLAVLLLLTQAVCSETTSSQVEDLEEGVSYTYPLFNDNAEASSAAGEKKNDSPQDESSSGWQGQLGNVKVTVDVENTDFISQRQAEWDKMQEKNKPKKKKKSRFRKDEDKEEKKDHSPRVSASFEWSD